MHSKNRTIHAVNGTMFAFVATFAIACALHFIGQSPAFAQVAPKHRILHINSYHSGYKWSDDIERGIDEVLALSSDTAVHHEYMDTKRLPGNDNIQAFKTYLQSKAAINDYDVIIVSDNNAFEFMRKYHQELFPEVPVVFCGVNFLKRYDLEGYDEFTGIKEETNFRANVELMEKLHPKARTLHVIVDRTTTGLQELKSLRGEARTMRTKLKIEFMPDLPMRDLLQQIALIPPDDLVFYAFVFRDRLGAFYEFNESASLISKACKAPIYGGWDYNLGHGIIGGMLTSGYHQGHAAATTARRILEGEIPSNIPVEGISANKYMFDYPQLQRFKVDEKLLPEGSIILNNPISPFSLYKVEILSVITIFGLLTTLLLALVRFNRRSLIAKAELQRNEESLRHIINTIPHMIYAKNADGEFLLANRALATTLGASPDEITGRLHMDIHPVQSEVEKMLSDDRKVLESEQAVFIPEQPYTDWLETTHWLQMTKVPFIAQDGQPAVLTVSTDITRRRQDEEKLINTRNALRSFIDSMTSILAGINENCTIVHWNAAATKATGYSANFAMGKDIFMLLPRLNQFEKAIRTAVMDQTPFEAIKIPVARDDNGAIHYEDVFVNPQVDGTGAVLRIDDVTERARIDAMMIQTEKMMSVGGLAAGMAHEINNPLGAILQGAQNISRRLSPEFKANKQAAIDTGVSLPAMADYMESRGIQAMLDGIHESAVRAAEIVRNMLEFSRKSESMFAPHDINQLLDRTIELASSDYDLKKSYDFKKIRIIRSFAQNLPLVPLTATEIEQVILNLLKNAAQAMHEQGATDESPCITLKTMQEQNHIRLEIQDNGPGLSPEVRKRVFEPFFTTKAPGIGTGLGLSVSYFIITQNHLGEFFVTSEEDKGATFVIKIPLERNDLDE